jgi:hypothetical protein
VLYDGYVLIMLTYPVALRRPRSQSRRTITIADWAALGTKARRDLTDDDLIVIRAFGGEQEADNARAQRAAALAPPAPPAPAATKATSAARTKEQIEADITSSFKAVSEFLFADEQSFTAAFDVIQTGLADSHRSKEIIYGLLFALRSVNSKTLERNVKIAALEARIAGLEERPDAEGPGTWKHGAT